MPTFAHIETGRTVDVMAATDLATYQRILNAPKSWQIVQVPAGTLNGATPVGDGTYTAPPAPPAPAPVPRTLTKTEFRAYAVSKLGTGLTGMARFQDIMDAAQGATGAVKFCFTQYQDAGDILRDDLAGFLDIMVSAKIVTQAEHDAVIGGWPTE
jgi:hypothetical protein